MKGQKPQLHEVAGEIAGSLGFCNLNFEGSGSYKETYSVTNPKGQRLALKISYPGKCSLSRTEREIHTLLRCDFISICKLYDFKSFHSSKGLQYYYALEEFLDGGTLSEKIASGSLTTEVIRRYAISLIQAIEYLKNLNVVHRDIKPDNIMFRSTSPEPVLVDFNIVRDLSEYSLTPTWAGQGPGTPYFSAPEQLNNEKNLIDWRTDQFSLGIVIGMCLTGQHPFQNARMNDADAVVAIAGRKPLDNDFRLKIERLGFKNIIEMLKPWPIQRFQSTQALLDSFKSGG